MLTVAQAAAELGVSRFTIVKRLQRDAMKGRLVSPKLWMISRKEVERWKAIGKVRAGRPRRAATEDEG